MTDRPAVLILEETLLYADALAVRLCRAGLPNVEVRRRLDVIEAARFDVVLVNTGMPDSARLVAELHRAGGPAVLILGAAERHESVVGCLQAGAVGFVSWQEPVDSLAAAIIEVAARGRLGGRRLTPRETQVLALISAGMSNEAIAHRLGVRLRTVKNHVHAILGKLDVPSRAAAAARFQATGSVR
ncbi:LuxR family transcriptional regulator [Nonomuraea sp. SYSU D8015]|uniref:LuxR family transcriptional regulator n=1 Tax=Nonomuraea sp. SYSU D8015 TaxID=2593644 RepID=UPI0016611918|nr:response regulator transcription factor [Nonomuraea sp. SYSU D8015]